jgi:aminodeoxyfutalosine synthase
MSVESASTLRPELARVARAGARLAADEVRELARLTDILALGALADDLRRARHGTRATFVRVHALDLAERDRWTEAPPAAREVRLVGTPASLDAAVEAVRTARALAGGRVVRGFTLTDVANLGATDPWPVLGREGLDEVAWVEPDDGAAALIARARAARISVRVVGAANPPVDRAAWLLAVRALADAAGGIDVVAPLARAQDPASPTTGFDDVRTVALTRIVLETVAHVQVDWLRYGPKLAQVALTVGADDLDGVPAVDDLSRGPRRAPLEDVRRNITAAALVPEERDARHGHVDS